MRKRYDLATFADESRAALLRNSLANYLKIGETFELMGTGFTKLDENPGAQSDQEIYINEVTSSASITGYQTEFPYESRLIPSQKAVYTLWKQGRDHAVGADAEMDYVVVDLFNPIGSPSEETAEYAARQFRVINIVESTTGNGGEKIGVSGKLSALGDPVQGKFDTVKKTFTAGKFEGKFDAAD